MPYFSPIQGRYLGIKKSYMLPLALKGRILYADPARQFQDSVENSAARRKDSPGRSRLAVSRLGNKKEVGSKHPPGHQGPRKEVASKQTGIGAGV